MKATDDDGLSRTVRDHSTALLVAVLGIVIGVSGALHGVHSMLTGNTPI